MKISIVMPVSDKIENFRIAIESVLKQTYRNIELILVNSVASDKQIELLRQYQEGDNRIKIYKSKRKQSWVKSLNFGFSVATGDYLMKMSDNMIFKSNALEQIMKIFQMRKNEDFIYTNILLKNLDGFDEKLTSYYNREMKNIYLYNPTRVSFIYKRKVYKWVGRYREKNIYDINNDFWIRVKEAGFSMYHLKKEVCNLLQNSSTLFKDEESFLEYRIKKCKEVLGSCEDYNVKNKILYMIIEQCRQKKRYYYCLLFGLYRILINNPISLYQAKYKKAINNCKMTFDIIADSYDNESSLEEPRKCYTPVMDIIKENVHDDVRLLDIGCGTGVMLQMIYNEFGSKTEMVGIDLSHEMVKISNQNLYNKKTRIIQGTIETVGLPKDFFDMALCMHSFHHYPKPLKSLWHMRKVLRKQGLLIIADNRYKGWERLERNFSLFMNNYPCGDMWMYSFFELVILTSLVGFYKQKYLRVGEKSFIFICEKR